jgi:predicted aspartyl protease
MRVFEGSQVPFRLCGQPQPLILLPANVNGHGPFSFILDTGAGLNLVTTRLAAVTGIEPAEVRRGACAAGEVTLGLGTAHTFCVGDVTVRDSRIGVTDELLRIGATVGARIDGAVGYEFLQRFCVTINYRRQIAIFSCSIGTDAGDRRKPIPFRLAKPEKPLVLVDAFIDENGPFQVALDTGASTTALSGEVASRLGMRRMAMHAVTGGGGAVEAEAAVVESIRLGNSSAGPLDVVVTNATDLVSRVLGERLDGILGYNFLRKFEVVIDYPRSSVVLSETG